MVFDKYEDALEFVMSLPRSKTVPDLDRLRKTLNMLGNPHRGLKYVHITGTNGKGSVSAFMASLIKEAGHSVGTFNSPYLIDFRDRIRYNGKEISKKDMLKSINKVCKVLDDYNSKSKDVLNLTFFELNTAFMFLYFAEKKPEYVILEVGMGGSWDATNVIDSPEVAIITNIAKDHEHILGNTELEIAKKKAGILKTGTVCIRGHIKKSNAAKHIEKVCEEKGVKLIGPKERKCILHSSDLKGQVFRFRYKDREFDNLKIKMLGKYQVDNVATALVAFLEMFPKTPEKVIRAGLEKARWRGRFEVISTYPLIILDGAHNPDGVRALAESLKEVGIEKPQFMVGMAPNKDMTEMAKEFLKISDTFVFTRAKSRGMDKAELKQVFSDLKPNVAFILKEMPGALVTAKRLARARRRPLVIAGSLYLIGEVLCSLQ